MRESESLGAGFVRGELASSATACTLPVRARKGSLAVWGWMVPGVSAYSSRRISARAMHGGAMMAAGYRWVRVTPRMVETGEAMANVRELLA